MKKLEDFKIKKIEASHFFKGGDTQVSATTYSKLTDQLDTQHVNYDDNGCITSSYTVFRDIE